MVFYMFFMLHQKSENSVKLCQACYINNLFFVQFLSPGPIIFILSLVYQIVSIVRLLLTSLMPSKCLPVCLCPNHQWEYRFPRAGDKLECGKKQRPLDSKTSTTKSMRFSQYYVVLACEPASFWRENVVAVVTLLQVLVRMSKWQKQVIKG